KPKVVSTATLDLVLSALDGFFSAFPEIGVDPFSKRFEKRLFGWKGLVKTINRVNLSFTLPLDGLIEVCNFGDAISCPTDNDVQN
ncbi:MAG: hypothetical protein ACI9OJ_003627, partial [Myxococcota bacterium]